MDSFEVVGGNRLNGEIIPQGAKNEALQILCAVLLTPETVKISNIPDIRDVNMLIEILGDIGVKVEKTGDHSYSFTASDIDLDYLKTEAFRDKSARLRGSVMLVGPLLARFGEAFMPQPGGDKIGRRPLDTHLIGFTKLGAVVEWDEKAWGYSVKAGQLKAGFIHMEEISVTGTANVLMAAAGADGESQIYNAACEPYLQQLCKLINSMGGEISGIGSNLLTVKGKKRIR